MKFKANSRRRALEYEKEILKFWKDNQIFEKSIEQRPESEAYVFYDGPPFITGVPHHGTLLSSIVKDAVPRYQTMKGRRVERRWGWDCHGLPAENFTEKKLGITDRHAIGTDVPLETYITTCRANMVNTGSLWEDTIDRIGRWVDFKGAYKTMDREFMESVWWAFKELYDKGKIYEGEKVLMYDTKWATPLSKAEVTMDAGAYQEVTDPSVYVKFKLEGRDKFLLAWTTTPWTLPANVVLAVNPELDYVEVEHNGEVLIMAKSLVEKTMTDEKHQPLDYEILREFKGEELVGLEYEPLFDDHNSKFNKPFKVLTDNDFIKNPSDFDNEKKRVREASRAVIKNKDKKIALMHSRKYNYYKLPGGGIKDEESKEAALLREALEEVGAHVKILSEIGRIDQILAFADNLHAISYVFECEVVGEIGENNLEQDEKGEDFEVVWVDLDKAIDLIDHKKLDSSIGINVKFFVLRDETLLREYRKNQSRKDNGKAHRVYAADYVSAEDGTGIVHTAPAYGEDDFSLAQQYGLPVVHKLDDYGKFIDGEWAGQDLWEANKQIAKKILADGKALKIDYIRHEYPHNPRTNERLIYRAHPSWFMDIDGQRAEMLENNQPINWFPGHIKNGRFAKTIETAPDWNLSRDRFWATAMPVWEGIDKDNQKRQIVVGSYAELKELSGVELEDYHRPWVDEVEFDKDGVHYKRVDKVLDCWFESGSMPFAQFHYPFENKDKFEQSFPGDFITEYVGQVRAWFYYVHAVSTALFGKNAFKNVIVTGTVAGNDGRKMSKSYGNYTDPNELMDKFSADSLRFLLLQSPLLNGEDYALIDKDVADVARKLTMIWNMYDFFTMYAEVDGWEFDGELTDPLNGDLSNPLDRWIVSRLHETIATIEQNMDAYNIPDAMHPILPLIEDASNWYVRRSRRRFWKSEDDADKNQAYRTLHYFLTRLSIAIAPFVPFLAEELYQKMTDGKSVHLLDWQPAGKVDQAMLDQMNTVREVVNRGLYVRAKEQIKVRQPLASVVIKTTLAEEIQPFSDIIEEELNVKQVKLASSGGELEVELDTKITAELRREGLAREVIRAVQNARKQAGLNVDDRINLALSTEDENLEQAIKEFANEIYRETLATSQKVATAAYDQKVKVEKIDLEIKLEKTTV